MEYANGPDLMKDEENDLFYFESDHLALKGNKDYCEVLKTIVILSAIREKALKDYSKVIDVRKKCLEDPLSTLEKLQSGEELGIPPLLELPKLPVINFEKFDVKGYENDIKAIYSNTTEKTEETKLKDKSTSSSRKEGAWTTEEQKRLEELLVIYPPEAIEIKRFQKIAAALGNRSVQQVTSRVQKYFIKLYKAGLPIPGRIPKSIEKYKRTNLHRHQRYNHQYLWKPSTFFPDLYVPVNMDEQDNTPGPSINPPPTVAPSTNNSKNYLLPTDYYQPGEKEEPVKNETELQLQLLKRVKAEKVKEQESDSVGLFRHFEYRCDYCDTEPITGSRWHCMTCSNSIDYCTDCLLSQLFTSDRHPLSHVFGVFRGNGEAPSLTCVDTDTQLGGGGAYKSYESDSNGSGDFDTCNAIDDFSQETVVNEGIMGQDNAGSEYEC